MRVELVCLEDGIVSCGFRKMAAYVERLGFDTRVRYISTNQYRSFRAALKGMGRTGHLDAPAIDEVARELADADLIGFSSMTGYADLTKAVIHRVKEISARPYIMWGGIHPIIHPEDAIAAGVDAICTGEGEFAFSEFVEAFQAGKDFTGTRNFWFNHNGQVIRNGFRPLMTGEEMESLPFPKYGEGEWIYKQGKGFVPLGLGDYLTANGLAYNAIWSIGCPFHCTYCGNTVFIANDAKYKKIRHPSAQYIVDEVKAALAVHPHISTVVFHDDSFMAIPYRQLEEFACLWREEVGIAFAVYGVIPNYVRREKSAILTWAGMNRIRMGIQSGSQRILDFYKRPTPVATIEQAAEANAVFSPRYQIPPAYDIITDNPIETKQDVLDTLNLLYTLARPYTLNIFALKVIPNSALEKQMKEHGVDIEEISATYNDIPPRWANILTYMLTFWKPPQWLFARLLTRVEASRTPQPMYPRLALLMRFLYIIKRGSNHLRFMDFSVIGGFTGYIMWRLGIVSFWWKHLTPRPPRPNGGAPPAHVDVSPEGQSIVVVDPKPA